MVALIHKGWSIFIRTYTCEEAHGMAGLTLGTVGAEFVGVMGNGYRSSNAFRS